MRLLAYCVLSGALAQASGALAQQEPLTEVRLSLRLPSGEAAPMVQRLKALLIHVPVRLRRTGGSVIPAPEILTIEIGPVAGDRIAVRFQGTRLQGQRTVQLRGDSIDEAAREALAAIVASTVRAHVQSSHAHATHASSSTPAQPVRRHEAQPAPTMPPASRRAGVAGAPATIKRDNDADALATTTTTTHALAAPRRFRDHRLAHPRPGLDFSHPGSEGPRTARANAAHRHGLAGGGSRL